ncbi:YggS family pyridoxal phosphate-dependent enzyme [Oxynema aestuarii]|uniref:Pyridoxal phosphate homeostasis protein n=1 Tax=Oxynema aestuarii AP17 TaxID=2064643 RepID=A0A6H1TUN3_9CYAN|nr:YggS family pyridoxal phosphate-dependent enzyme [Oxynema aestuarii]QIZ69660.1 YggS family pyridoxal phosphate-dependent enzyme [Oxynema aestuarii AP17]RMH76631.1 MAG: YggS family pyridoxal phosphate-dependent enzyme [Cyanobacteria bacterium J007]
MSSTIARRLDRIRSTLPPSVRLIAVTKQVSVPLMREAYAAGIRDFGENRIQEADSKYEQLQDLPDITWHGIGHVQSNKAKRAVELFDWIHSCDSLKLARRLNRLAGELSRSPQVCLQVKLLPDPNKYGWSVEQLWQDLPELDRCEHLQIKGLMAIAPLGLDEGETATLFARAAQLARDIGQQPWQRLQMTELSMGMSGDYALAVGQGATMVRLGRILFGERS